MSGIEVSAVPSRPVTRHQATAIGPIASSSKVTLPSSNEAGDGAEGDSVHAAVRPRDRSSGRFKKRRPPPSTTPAGAIEARICTLERQLLEHQVASYQQQVARRVAVEAHASLHSDIARLKGELKKRGARSNNTEGLTVAARHQAALNAVKARNVLLSARNKVLSNTVAPLKRAEQERVTREHLRVVKNRRVEEELEDEVAEAYRPASDSNSRRLTLPHRFSERSASVLASAIAGCLHECAPKASSEEEAKRCKSLVVDRLRSKFSKTWALRERRQQSCVRAPKVAPCCKAAIKAAIKDIESFWDAEKGSSLKTKLRLSYKKMQRMIRGVGQTFNETTGRYTPAIMQSCGLEFP